MTVAPVLGVRWDKHELLGAATALRRLDADQRREVARVTRTTLTPAWQRLLRYKVVTSQQRAVFGPGRVGFTAGGKGTLVVQKNTRWPRNWGDPMGKHEAYWLNLVDAGSRRAYGRTGQLPSHRGSVIIGPAAKTFSGYAAQAYLWVLASTLRQAFGMEV